MKKIISSVLTLVMAGAMSVAAFAANPIVSEDGSDSADVKGTYAAGESTATVYSVDITWGSMDFTYTAGSDGTWDPKTHAYNGVTEGAWSCASDANKITVTNHSNAAIEATLSYAASTGYTGITGNFEGTIEINKLIIASAVGTDKTEAPIQTANLTLEGELASNTEANTIIGTVTVSLTNESSEDSLQS